LARQIEDQKKEISNIATDRKSAVTSHENPLFSTATAESTNPGFKVEFVLIEKIIEFFEKKSNLSKNFFR
jgi:hypothetical protein